MRTTPLSTTLVMLACLIGCDKGLQMDYGQPAAQFVDTDVGTKGRAYIGRKITVKGTITKIDASDSRSSWIHLGNGVRCNLGKFKGMAESSDAGDTVFVDGFLKHCDIGDVLLEPAILRDPTAPFAPEQ